MRYDVNDLRSLQQAAAEADPQDRIVILTSAGALRLYVNEDGSFLLMPSDESGGRMGTWREVRDLVVKEVERQAMPQRNQVDWDRGYNKAVQHCADNVRDLFAREGV